MPSLNANRYEGTHDALQMKSAMIFDHSLGMTSRRSSLAQHTTWSSKLALSGCTASDAIRATMLFGKFNSLQLADRNEEGASADQHAQSRLL